MENVGIWGGGEREIGLRGRAGNRVKGEIQGGNKGYINSCLRFLSTMKNLGILG